MPKQVDSPLQARLTIGLDLSLNPVECLIQWFDDTDSYHGEELAVYEKDTVSAVTAEGMHELACRLVDCGLWK